MGEDPLDGDACVGDVGGDDQVGGARLLLGEDLAVGESAVRESVYTSTAEWTERVHVACCPIDSVGNGTFKPTVPLRLRIDRRDSRVIPAPDGGSPCN